MELAPVSLRRKPPAPLQPGQLVCLVPTGATPAVREEVRIRATYTMRDRLMAHHAFNEQLATAIAALCIDSLRPLTDDELVDVKRAANEAARQQRDVAIRAELRTGNADEVARRHGISRRRVYEIANRR